jgi:hypothetical protein
VAVMVGTLSPPALRYNRFWSVQGCAAMALRKPEQFDSRRNPQLDSFTWWQITIVLVRPRTDAAYKSIWWRASGGQ